MLGSDEPKLFLKLSDEVFDNVFCAALSDLRLGELDLAWKRGRA